MKALLDSTVLLHLNAHKRKMLAILDEKGIQDYCISRINYIEILAGASENAKISTRKFLQQFEILEFNQKATQIANKLSMKYRVSSRQHKDFMIAATCIANNLPILTENNKDYKYDELAVISYRIR